jgi:hypothetical protein
MSIQESAVKMPKVSAFQHSRFGIISFSVALLDLLYFILSMFFWRDIGENSILYKVMDRLDYSHLSLIAWCLIAFLGIVFCMIGAKKDQRKIFSFLGLLLGAPIFWFLFVGTLLEIN